MSAANVIETRDVLDRRQVYFVVEGLPTLGVCTYEWTPNGRFLKCLTCRVIVPEDCVHMRAVATRNDAPEAVGLSGERSTAVNQSFFD